MGCGKSSVGERLSELLCCPFIDLDDVIVKTAGKTIPEIFASEGEDAFRRMEQEILTDIVAKEVPYAQGGRIVLSLGGGTVMTPECAEMVKKHTLCFYLRASADTLAGHLEGESEGRPMLQGDLRARIEGLMAIRSATYENTAHIIIDTDGRSIDETADEIARLIG